MMFNQSTLALAIAFSLGASASPAFAQTAPAQKAAPAKGMKRPLPVKRVVEPPAPIPTPATEEQTAAAQDVFYGVYECEFKQSVNIVQSSKYPSYVDVKHGKADYLMKPVLSSTGAIRLEDIRGETLMVQISSKSMLLNVKTAQRIVDDCVSPRQRELIEAARVAKAAKVAEAAQAVAPSAPSSPVAPGAAAPAAASTEAPAPVRAAPGMATTENGSAAAATK